VQKDCLICGKEIPRSKNSHAGVRRPADSLTCCRKCSRRYNLIAGRIKNKFSGKILSLEKKIKRLKNEGRKKRRWNGHQWVFS